jgi:hypothetical protein
MQKPGIKLMADYHCWPLWHYGSDAVGNLDPRSLGVSDALAERLEAWAFTYDSHLNSSDPAATSWTPEEEEEFDSTGRHLCVELAEEIGDHFEVFFFDSANGCVISAAEIRT